MNLPDIIVRQCRGDRLIDDRGRAYLDVCMGFGAAFVGHGNAAVQAALEAQLKADFSPGFLTSGRQMDLQAALEGWLPAGHQALGVFCGGTESVELAMRIAGSATGRDNVVGFNGAHHGRSRLTRALGQSDPGLPFVHSLPFLPDLSEQVVLDQLEQQLRTLRPAAVFVEPAQMSSGGYGLSDAGLQQLAWLVKAQGSLLVFDELLTGGYRCGRRFWFEWAGIEPDLLVCGKAIAGGFPVGLVSAHRDIGFDGPAVGLRNTFSNHPLGQAAIVATLAELQRLDAAGQALRIGRIVQEQLPAERILGRGALWSIRFDDPESTRQAFHALLEQRIVTSFRGAHLRLLPAVISSDHALTRVCTAVRQLL